MTFGFNEWDLVILKENDSINTQVVWHAATLARSSGIQERDLIIIDWPKSRIVSCGLHQSIEHVVDLETCKINNIPVIRRSCGGGTVLLDSNQLFYNVIAHISSKIIPRQINKLYSKLLEPVVQTYHYFNINAYYKPVNDILVNGKKISGNGASLIEKAQVLVGNFILDFPRQLMANILRVPDEKFRGKVYQSLETSMSSFQDELGYIPDRDEIIEIYTNNVESILNLTLIPTSLESETLKLMKELRRIYLTDEWLFQVSKRGKNLINKIKIHNSKYVVEGNHKSSGGLIQTICEFYDSILLDILITGDFWIFPETIIPELEQHLRNIDIKKVDLKIYIEQFLNSHRCKSPGTSALDITQSILNAYQNIN